MKIFIALATVAVAAVFLFFEMYAFVTRHVGRNPFVNPRRFFRRTTATGALVVAFLGVLFFEEITTWLPGWPWKVSLLGIILILLLLALALALRDAIKTARIAVQEDAAFRTESARMFRDKLLEAQKTPTPQRKRKGR